MSLLARAAGLVPEPMVPAARRWFYLLYPRVSWRKRRKVETATDEFVGRFFDDRSEYEAYREEFFDGRIVDICREGDAALGDEASVYDAHRDECAKLYALVRKRRPATVVETGVFHGVSTAAILLALAENGFGTLHSVDPSHATEDDYYAAYVERERPSCSEPGAHELGDREPGWILPDDLRDRWQLTRGRPHSALPAVLRSVPPVDVFLQDSLHATSAMLYEFELAWEHLAAGGVIVSPHVGNNDALATFAREHDCESGLVSFDYNGLEGYEAAGQCGYALKEGAA